MARLAGDKNAFWNNAAAVGAGAASTVVQIANVDSITIWATTSGATTLSIQVSHRGDISPEGIESEEVPSVWHDLYVNTVKQEIVFAGAGSRAVIVRGVGADLFRLSNLTAGVTLTAGWSGYSI